MSEISSSNQPGDASEDAASRAPRPPRRQRYRGKNPRRFEDKYKEHQPKLYAETVAKVRASGKTPAGQHVPVMLAEIMEVLAPQAGERVVDGTLGYGGHAEALLRAVQPGGCLLGLDQDPVEIVKTESRLRFLGFPEGSLRVQRTNFAALGRVLNETGWADGADVILVDLGVSSMQLDNPARGFSYKHDGPLDMRMNPQRSVSARELLQKLSADKLAALLEENSNEPRAAQLAEVLAGHDFAGTLALAIAVKKALPRNVDDEEAGSTLSRVFQALRIAVNDEFSALDTFLRELPRCLRSDGRVAILTFHSGEDRRVKKSFQAAARDGLFVSISDEVQRPSADEIWSNPRAAPAKLRLAVRL